MKRQYKNSGIPWIGEIPSDWNVVRTKNVFACSKSLVGEDWSHTQLLSLTTKGVKEVAIGSTSGKVPDSYETYQVVNKDDLVMCLFDLDCSAVFSGVSNFHGMISPAYKVLKTLDGYSPAFYGYWFDYIFDGRKYKYLSKNIRYSLTYDEFAALGIAAPPLPTQQRIADYLDRKCAEIDELAALQETMIAELKRYKQSVITEAVTKGLDPNVPMQDSGVEWIGEIPEGWMVRKIKDVAFFFNGDRGKNYPSGDDMVKEGIYFLTSNNIRGIIVDCDVEISKFITLERYDILGGAKIQLNDIIYCLRGSIGNCAINKKLTQGTVASSLMTIRPTHISSDFLNYYLHSQMVKFQTEEYMNGSCAANLSAENVSRYIVMVPPLAEQRAIADYLDKKCGEIDELIAIKQQKIDALKEYKKSVIFEYVTGKKEII